MEGVEDVQPNRIALLLDVPVHLIVISPQALRLILSDEEVSFCESFRQLSALT